MGILEGKNILVAGVTMNTSIGYRVVELAQAEGANVVVSNFGRALGLTGRVLKRLDPVPPLLELDVTDEEHLATLAERVGEHVDHLDGVVHSIAYANPDTALGGKFLTTPFSDVSTSVPVSYTHLDVYKRQLLGHPVVVGAHHLGGGHGCEDQRSAVLTVTAGEPVAGGRPRHGVVGEGDGRCVVFERGRTHDVADRPPGARQFRRSHAGGSRCRCRRLRAGGAGGQQRQQPCEQDQMFRH